jgi:AraC family transcriptional regulator, positive regulator of tynA and feaB
MRARTTRHVRMHAGHDVPVAEAPTWSTASVETRHQFGYWRDAVCDAFLHLTPERLAVRVGQTAPFHGAVTKTVGGAIEVAHIDADPQRVHRTEADIASGDLPRYYLNVQVHGSGAIVQDGRVAVLTPGQMALVDTTRPFTFEFTERFGQRSLHLDRRLVEPHVPGPVPTATVLDGRAGMGAVFLATVHTLATTAVQTRDEPWVHDQLGAMLARLLPLPPIVDRDTVLRRRAVELIEAASCDPSFDPAAAACELGVSVRLLHRAFAGTERSFAAELRHRRLISARRMLRPGARVSDVAFACGFDDVSTFHRAYRREYGTTPGVDRFADRTAPVR